MSLQTLDSETGSWTTAVVSPPYPLVREFDVTTKVGLVTNYFALSLGVPMIRFRDTTRTARGMDSLVPDGLELLSTDGYGPRSFLRQCDNGDITVVEVDQEVPRAQKRFLWLNRAYDILKVPVTRYWWHRRMQRIAGPLRYSYRIAPTVPKAKARPAKAKAAVPKVAVPKPVPKAKARSRSRTPPRATPPPAKANTGPGVSGVCWVGERLHDFGEENTLPHGATPVSSSTPASGQASSSARGSEETRTEPQPIPVDSDEGEARAAPAADEVLTSGSDEDDTDVPSVSVQGHKWQDICAFYQWTSTGEEGFNYMIM